MKFFREIRIITLFITSLISTSVLAKNDNIVNVYNWASYISPKVLSLFEKETGIHINYSTFDSNQTLYTKIKADPNAGYDVIVPSSYVIYRMRLEGMLHKLDKSKFSNFKYVDPKLLNKSYDPHNQYSIPYLWGTTGIILNKKYYKLGTITHWNDLWKPTYKNQISLLNSMRDNFAMAMRTLGYSINDENPEHIRQAYLKLKALLPNVQSFESNGSQQMYVNEDSNLGMIANGDAQSVIDDNANYYYVYPKEGALIWVDNVAIPLHAKHIENAYKFINFIMRPDIAKMISLNVNYASPNLGAVKLMSKSIRKNRVLYPTKKDLKNSEIESYIKPKITKIYLKYWELLKIGA